MSDPTVDQLAVQRLLTSYTDAVNRRDPAAATAVYTPDGVLNAFGFEIVGHEKLRRNFDRVFGRYQLLFQHPHVPLVDVDGDRAWARCWLTEYNTAHDGTSTFFLGTYQDEIVRTPDGWRFARRTLDAVYRGEKQLVGETSEPPGVLHPFGI
jgi:ketosteroid isomerase-like protein